eukprot:COSAG01_NODE_21033_length_921_cov_2.546229_1_plen_306_part_11
MLLLSLLLLRPRGCWATGSSKLRPGETQVQHSAKLSRIAEVQTSTAAIRDASGSASDGGVTNKVAKTDDAFSVHVPLYDPRLSPTSPEIDKLLWAAQRVRLSVTVCGSFYGCEAIGQCCDAGKNEQAAKILRAAGVTVLHYVPTMRLPAAASPVCCNSLSNVTKMVQAALSNNASDGVYFDVVTGLNKPGELPFFLDLYRLVQSHAPRQMSARPVMFNPSTPSFLEAYVKLDGVRVNGFESTLDRWPEAKDSRLFDWSRVDRRRFAMVTEKAANITQMESALHSAAALNYGVFFVEPDEQDYWKLP